MKVLVTGASGFLGRRVLEQLADSEYEVHAVARRPANGPATAWYATDLLAPQERDQLLALIAPSHLIHLAWTTEHGEFWESEENADWTAATVDLVEHFARHGGRRALLTGSCAEYDWADPSLAITGCHELTTPLLPTTRYGNAKLEAFRTTSLLGEQLDVAIVWARLFFMFGIEEHEARLVPTLVRASLRGERTDLRHPDRILDFMSTRDVAKAYVEILRSSVTGPMNVASGRGVRVSSLAQTIDYLTGAPLQTPAWFPAGPRDAALRLVADVRRLSTEVNFDPKHDLEASLAPVVDWWRSRTGG